MKLEVGMYVRLNREIGKVTRIYERADGNMVFDIGRYQYYFTEINKASHKIEDLLKKGDYVNGYMITDFSNEYYDEELDDYVEGFSIVLGNEEQMYSIPPKDIETVLTKEQFESMAYKVV